MIKNPQLNKSIAKGRYMSKDQTKKKKLTPQNEKFIKGISEGKNQTDSYQEAYPKPSRPAARRAASRLLTNVDILQAIQKRKEHLAQMANVTEQQILGATAEIAFASMEDVLDDKGNFDFRKAVKTNAASLIKK